MLVRAAEIRVHQAVGDGVAALAKPAVFRRLRNLLTTIKRLTVLRVKRSC